MWLEIHYIKFNIKHKENNERRKRLLWSFTQAAQQSRPLASDCVTDSHAKEGGAQLCSQLYCDWQQRATRGWKKEIIFRLQVIRGKISEATTSESEVSQWNAHE